MNQSKETLVVEHMNFAVMLVKMYFNAYENRVGFERDDLIQEAYMALIKAANTFDDARGIKFETYATRVIRNELAEYCSKNYESRERLGINDAAVEMGYIGEPPSYGNSHQEKEVELCLAIDNIFEDVELSEDVGVLVSKLREMLHGNKTCAMGAIALMNSLRGISQVETANMLDITAAHLRACVKRARNRLEESRKIVMFKNELLGIAE